MRAALCRQAITLHALGNDEEALHVVEEALSLCRQEKNAAALADCLNLQSKFLCSLDTPSRGSDDDDAGTPEGNEFHASELPTAGSDSGNRPEELSGSFARPAEYSRAMKAKFKEVGLRRVLLQSNNDLLAAEDALARAAAISRELGETAVLSEVQRTWAAILHGLGRIEEALAVQRDAESLDCQM